MVEKVGQRKFLLKEGYTEEQLDKMSPSQAHSIISKIEKENEIKRQKEKIQCSIPQNLEDLFKPPKEYIRNCLICGSAIHVSYNDFYNQPVVICNHCKEAIMKVREEYNLF